MRLHLEIFGAYANHAALSFCNKVSIDAPRARPSVWQNDVTLSLSSAAALQTCNENIVLFFALASLFQIPHCCTEITLIKSRDFHHM
jgi:hypothetical protein